MVLMASATKNLKFTPNCWVADSGASTHMTNSPVGLYNVKQVNQKILVGDGRSMLVTKIGTWKGTFLDAQGKTQNIILEDVQLIPELMTNLFSLTKAMKKGFTISGQKTTIEVSKGNWKLKFSKLLSENENFICGVNIKPTTEKIEIGFIGNTPLKPTTLEAAHTILGHSGRDKTLATSKQLGWKISNPTNKSHSWKCIDCQIGKAQKLNVPKEDGDKSTTPGERLMIDISSVKTSKYKKRVGKFWLLIVDQCTNMKWCYFLKHKDDQIRALMDFIKAL